MKVDGRAIAKAMARRKENMEQVNEGHEMEREVEAQGEHIKAMSSFIEAIHHKEPEKAHEHMNNYMALMNQKKPVD